MADKILTAHQHEFLEFVKKQPTLIEQFYFTGGTCLSEYYLHHRFSEDLDFFSENEIDPQAITILLHTNKSILGYKKMDFQQSFNRNLFFLIFSKKQQLKIEFTYFPFERIDSSKSKNGLSIDSMQDIAVNKLFTIYQKPRGRDFYDLFAMYRKTPWNLRTLMKLARIKFDTNIDPLQLGRNLIQVEELKDDPLVINQKYQYKEVATFFNKISRSLKSEVIG
ncbi:hypothetical protein CO178_00615 [candidate division WWE3 bacterium CG_4_9_14_3_um_filter_34_6]|uniref:Nucleotidyl transferase AbiEii/AbiGii toxin family protein n=1 Tax=candidate division WWE3 bacterium CG_4_9_14_3_um_filter_34_6 TaxID=1975079 RepID=A0A2M7X566_UNCKA|nr:MAG: hypothetical protein CO178_00615 [candidate division WWE3 bacterium CG_4_9_14_3_um_filter_34_6]